MSAESPRAERRDLWAERRLERRAPAEVRVSVCREPGGAWLAASSRNLSGSGAYLVLDEPLAVFERLLVRLTLPLSSESDGERDEIRLSALVVRRDEIEEEGRTRHCHALYFDRVSPRDRERVNRFVDGWAD